MDALCAELGFQMLSSEQDLVRRVVAAARGVLGDTAYAATWNEGRDMRPDEAVAKSLLLNG